MTWTQPVCEAHWRQMADHHDDREPYRYRPGPDEQPDLCCFCLAPTTIYVRLDPVTVPHPRREVSP